MEPLLVFPIIIDSAGTFVIQTADAIVHPWQQNANQRCNSWIISIFLGIITLGTAQIISWFILRATRGSVNSDLSARMEQVSNPILNPLQSDTKKTANLFHNLPEDQKQAMIKEIYAIHRQLYDSPNCTGWLAENVNNWKLDLKLTWSSDYLINTKKYLDHLARLEKKTEAEREAILDRGLRANRVFRDLSLLQDLLVKDIWFRGVTDETLLIGASYNDWSSKAIPILLQVGIDPNQADCDGNTPLHWSVANAQVESTFTLIQYAEQYQIDFDRQDWGYYCMTPLQLAICKGPRAPRWSELITRLIAHTKQLDKQDRNGNTALHFACVRRDIPCIKALQTAGANFNIRNADGKTAMDLWPVSFDEAWKILKGSEITTTLLRAERELAGDQPLL